MSGVLHQDILPSGLDSVPSAIAIRKLTLQTSGAISRHVLDNDVEVLGVAVRLSSSGGLDAVAFATLNIVFYVDSSGTHASMNKARTELERMLDDPRCVLAGFGMARLALHLYRHFGVHVQHQYLPQFLSRLSCLS